MKKSILTFALLLSAISGFAQLSKSDMETFFERNPVSGFSRIEISNMSFTGKDVPKFSFSESALYLGYTDIGGRLQELIYPYQEIKKISTYSTDQGNRILTIWLRQ